MIRARLLACGFWIVSMGFGQSTQGLIVGRVTETQGMGSLVKAVVEFENLALNRKGSVQTNEAGYYAIAALSPGQYRIRVEMAGYQAQEQRDLEVPVGGALVLNFKLRARSDVWEKALYRSFVLPGTSAAMPYFGPDLDTTLVLMLESERVRMSPLETSVSMVVDPQQIRDLPLSGRDVYGTLVLQPGVTSDSATTRGLGISVNGQRPSSSNFLLDGMENNNVLTSGPLTALAPEAVQEYRISTSSFSAEFGRTSGFVANAVTKARGREWHGLVYSYGKTELLNAAPVHQKERSQLREWQPGYSLGGPILGQRLFLSSALEIVRYRSELEARQVAMPTRSFLSNCIQSGASCQGAKQLLGGGGLNLPEGSESVKLVRMVPLSRLRRLFLNERVDSINSGGKQRSFGRVSLARINQPEAIWSPYPNFSAALDQNSPSVAGSHMSEVRTGLLNELRLGWSEIDIRFDEGRSSLPVLQVGTPAGIQYPLALPTPATFFTLRDRNRIWQIGDQLSWTTGRMQWKVGGGWIWRDLTPELAINPSGLISFGALSHFENDMQQFRYFSIARRSVTPSVPQPVRQYRVSDGFGFVQNSFRVTPRLTLNAGLRWDRMGDPHNVGEVKDGLLEAKETNSPVDAFRDGTVQFGGAGRQRIYHAEQNQIAGRLAASYRLWERQGTLIRGAVGTFFDRPFDNLWINVRSNDTIYVNQRIESSRGDYLAPVADQIGGLGNSFTKTELVNITSIQPRIQPGRAHTYFSGLAQRLGSKMEVEWNVLGSVGRKLIATDLQNRDFTVRASRANPLGRVIAGLPSISYRTDQGKSRYQAQSLVARYRGEKVQFQVAYTWSRSRDNQSEPLAGEFNFADLRLGGSTLDGLAAFSRQFDWMSDYGNSDFDQRHNLVFYSIWDLPGWMRGWRLSQLGAMRSGRPYSVLSRSTATTQEILVNNRADVCRPGEEFLNRDFDGGKLLLNRNAFCFPGEAKLGSSGRNAYYGPGLFLLDLSAARTFRWKSWSEAKRFQLRVDAFNVLNHANLGNPSATLGEDARFGVAEYGRTAKGDTGLFAAPLREAPRQLQIMLRFEF